MNDIDERVRGFFLLLPDPASLQAILKAVRVDVTHGRSPPSAIARYFVRSPGGSIRRTRARTTTSACCTTTRGCTRKRSRRS